MKGELIGPIMKKLTIVESFGMSPIASTIMCVSVALRRSLFLAWLGVFAALSLFFLITNNETISGKSATTPNSMGRAGKNTMHGHRNGYSHARHMRMLTPCTLNSCTPHPTNCFYTPTAFRNNHVGERCAAPITFFSRGLVSSQLCGSSPT